MERRQGGGNTHTGETLLFTAQSSSPHCVAGMSWGAPGKSGHQTTALRIHYPGTNPHHAIWWPECLFLSRCGFHALSRRRCCIRQQAQMLHLAICIKGFFDNVNQGRLNPLMDSLGFPRKICDWTCSFPDDRSFCLSFNGATSDPRTSP